MDNSILYILLIFILIIVTTIIIVYFVIKGEDKVMYINHHENNSGTQLSRLVLERKHLNKVLNLDGGGYSIYLQDNLKNENGTITIIHLDDVLDKINIIYPSNIYIVEYSSQDTPYETGEYDINGKLYLYPNSTGNGRINWHKTVITINSNLTNVNINCMVLDDKNFQVFT